MRKLASIQKITNIRPIDGADKIELADWASRMATYDDALEGRPDMFPYEDAKDAVYSFSGWDSTPEGIDYWLTVVRGVKGSGVQFLYDNPIDEFVPS